jgi:hypothetical protein
MYYYEVDKNTWKKFINKVYEYLMEYWYDLYRKN